MRPSSLAALLLISGAGCVPTGQAIPAASAPAPAAPMAAPAAVQPEQNPILPEQLPGRIFPPGFEQRGLPKVVYARLYTQPGHPSGPPRTVGVAAFVHNPAMAELRYTDNAPVLRGPFWEAQPGSALAGHYLYLCPGAFGLAVRSPSTPTGWSFWSASSSTAGPNYPFPVTVVSVLALYNRFGNPNYNVELTETPPG